MRKILLGTVFALASMAGAGIEWGAPKFYAGDADVNTNGVLRYAYSWSGGIRPLSSWADFDSVQVNGVTFVPVGQSNKAGLDVSCVGLSSYSKLWRNWSSNQVATATCSTNAVYLVANAAYSNPNMVATVTLKNLLPGHAYEVQFWSSSVFPELAGGRFLLDGAIEVALNRGDDPDNLGMGQHVTGSFVCDATGTQSFTFTTREEEYGPLNALQVRDVTPGSPISWTVGAVTDENDVATGGHLVCAFTQSGHDVMVNGVPFRGVAGISGYPSTSPLPAPAFLYLTVTGMTSPGVNYFAPNGGPTEAYYELLRGAGYGGDGGSPGAGIMLHGLTPGHSYLVQIWVNDARPDIGTYRSVMIDEQALVRYKVGNWGEYAIGRFQAIADTQWIPFRVVVPAGTSNRGSLQWNALQVRELDPDAVDWEAPEAIAGAEQVRTDGELVAAYCANSTNVTVNGVTFQTSGTSSASYGGGGSRVSISPLNTIRTDVDFYPGWEDRGQPAEMHELLRCSAYQQVDREVEVKLTGLEPGRRYLVQLFSADTRSFISNRGAVIDGYRRFYTSQSSYEADITGARGTSLVGTFTAAGPEKTLFFRAIANDIKFVGSNYSINFNAIQLRQFGAPSLAAQTEWSVGTIDTASDVSTEGTLAYAYTFAASSLEVNGVMFTQSGAGASLGSNITLKNAIPSVHRQFDSPYNPVATPLVSDDPYRKLIASGIYNDSIDANVMTLKNLTPGHAYLVQLWATDQRGGYNDRYLIVDGTATLRYYHDFLTGRFLATAETKEIGISYYAKHGQLTAVQVRDLGVPADGLTVAPGTFTPDADLATNAVFASGSLTIGGTHAVDLQDGVGATDCTIAAPWGGSLLRQVFNCPLTLSGAADNLEGVHALAGTVTLAGETAKPLVVDVQDGATVAVAAGKTVVVAAFSGTGTCAGPGTIELANPHAGSCSVALTGGVTLRKTGVLDWVVDGPIDGATVVGETPVIIAGDVRTESFAVGGDVAFLGPTLGGTLTIASDTTARGLAFGTGGRLRLAGTSELAVTDAPNLEGVEISVETARRPDGNVLLACPAPAISGTPVFTFDETGFVAEYVADLGAWCAKASGFIIYIR